MKRNGSAIYRKWYHSFVVESHVEINSETIAEYTRQRLRYLPICYLLATWQYQFHNSVFAWLSLKVRGFNITGAWVDL